MVQGCHKTRSSNPLLYLIHVCSNWILKPSTTSAYISSHNICPKQARIFSVVTCALLYSTPKASLLPKRRPNELDKEVGSNTLEHSTLKRLQTRTHPSIKPQLSLAPVTINTSRSQSTGRKYCWPNRNRLLLSQSTLREEFAEKKYEVFDTSSSWKRLSPCFQHVPTTVVVL